MAAMMMAGWMALGALLGPAVGRAVDPPTRPGPKVIVEVRVLDPELTQMARELEREVHPLLPAGAAMVTLR